MIEVDSKDVLKLFSNLRTKNQTKALRSALSTASNILVKETRSQLKASGIKKTNSIHTTKRGGKYSLSRGIRSRVKRDGSDAKVHIMGDFRLKFFEMGTNSRRTKKGANRGRITSKKFFEKARTNKEKEIFSNMNKIISDSIMKIAKK